MEIIKTYHDLLHATTEIALATSTDNVPNVRIVSYVTNESKPGVLYFATERLSPKVAEMLLNEHVALTTIPRAGAIGHIRSHKALVKKSAFSFNDLKEQFIANIVDYDETAEVVGDALDVFEIHIKEAELVTGFEEPQKIAFTDIA